MNKKRDLIILFSGGLDSTLLLKIALASGYHPYCVLIDYGQKHKRELDFAQEMCLQEKVPYKIMGVAELPDSALTGTHEKQLYGGVSEWHVPSRNLIFVALAASIAESRSISTIWYGANYDDREHLFPDCYQEWVYKVNELLSINGSTPLRLEAPLLGMDKEVISKLAVQYNIDQKQIFSGYGEKWTNVLNRTKQWQGFHKISG